MTQDKLKKLEEIIRLANDGLTKEEFVQSFETVIKVIKDIKDTNTKEWNLIHDTINKLSDKLKTDTSSDLSDIKKQVDHVFVKERLDEIKKEVDSYLASSLKSIGDKMSGVDKKMSFVKSGYTPRKGVDYFDGKHGNVIAPNEVKIKLESLSGDNRLDVSAIRGMDEIKNGIDDKIGKIKQMTAPRSSQAMRIYDISSQANGVTKVFSVPKGLMGLVIGSDFPTVLMENNGFTLNKSRTQLTTTYTAPPSSGSQLVYLYMSIFNI